MGNSPRVGKFTGPKDKGQGRHHGESEGALKRERKREKGVEERERQRDIDKDKKRAHKCLDHMGKSSGKSWSPPGSENSNLRAGYAREGLRKAKRTWQQGLLQYIKYASK